MSNNTTIIYPLKTTEGKVRLAIYITSLILGTFGGFVVLFVIFTKKLRDRTEQHLFLANLAIADMSTIWLYVGVHFVLLSGHLHESFCYVWPLLSVPLCTSIFTIASMAIVRYRRIVRVWSHKIRSSIIIVWVVGLWVASITVFIPAIIVSRYSNKRYCYLAWPKVIQRKIYVFSLFAFQYLIPLVIISVAYIGIAFNLKHYEGQVERGSVRQENRAIIKALAIIAIIFALFLMPLQIGSVMFEFGDISIKRFVFKFMTYSDILCILHSCINPFVYGIVPREYYTKWTSALFRSISRSKMSLYASYRMSSIQQSGEEEEGTINECKPLENIKSSGECLKTASLQI